MNIEYYPYIGTKNNVAKIKMYRNVLFNRIGR